MVEKVQLILQLLHPYIPISMVIREMWVEGVYQTHDLNIHLGKKQFLCHILTQLQISKISIKTSKAWKLMFSLWGCLSDTWFEYSFRKKQFLCQILTQLQISKISIKTSKAWTLMFSLWGCLSDTWFEYSFRKETVLCQICNSASNLKHFYQDIYLKNEHGCFHFLGFDLKIFRYLWNLHACSDSLNLSAVESLKNSK